MLKTVDLRVLVNADLDVGDFIWRLLGRIPYGAQMSGEVVGAAELDKDGIPVPKFPVREGIEWDGWPREATQYSMSMPNDPELQAEPEFRQTVKVYQHDGSTVVIVAAETVIVRDGKPGQVRITGEDGRTVYMSAGDWKPVAGTWDCAARIEEKSA